MYKTNNGALPQKLHTDFIIFRSKSQQKKLNPFFPVNILGESLIPSDAVKNLGVWFDSDFSFTKHVKNVCKLCFIQMRDLRQIRQYLTCDAALMAANALVGSRLDYCNSLFRGLSVANLRKLQCIQNSLAKTLYRATCLSHSTKKIPSLATHKALLHLQDCLVGIQIHTY